MNVLFCGYRNWALDVLFQLEHALKTKIQLVQNHDELINLTSTMKFDIIIVVGWSWKIPEIILRNSYVVGMHPSDLPQFAGGSPLQHQIISGLEKSVATLFRLTPDMDAGPILMKKQYELLGHMNNVFDNLSKTTFELLYDFLNHWPNIDEIQQEKGGSKCRRLKPENSQIQKSDIQQKTCKELWNLIRCREDPYPNVFLEDETGRLIITRVEFKPS